MADNRILLLPRSLRGDAYQIGTGVGSDTNQARAEADLVALRDMFRAAFAGPRFVTSDIAKWNGTASVIGMCFVFRDTIKGCEWLYGVTARTNASSSLFAYNAWGNNTAATMGVYFKMFATTSWSDPNQTYSASGLLHFNPNYAGATYAMGFDNTTTLTYTGGDFTAPASSPYSALSTFMPTATGRYHGVHLPNWSGSSVGVYFKRSFMYDLDLGVLCYDMSSTAAGGVACISGKEMYPTHAQGGLADPADTRQDALVMLPYVVSGQWFSLETSAYLLSVHVRPDGTTVDNLARPMNVANDFARQNYLSSGEVLMRKLQMGLGLNIKGHLDPRIINQSFPHADFGFNYMPLAYPDADNPMIHNHPQFTRMWKKETPYIFMIPDAGLISDI